MTRNTTRTAVYVTPEERIDDRIEIRCEDCGYGAIVRRIPGRCPMCGRSVWSTTHTAGGSRR